jgi:hypothetical protein
MEKANPSKKNRKYHLATQYEELLKYGSDGET